MIIPYPTADNSQDHNSDPTQQLNKFAYAVSHDMGTPLRHVKGFTELLERTIGEKLDDRTEGYLKHIKEATNRLDSMMEGVLGYSRITTRGKPPRPFETQKIIAEVITDILEKRVRTPLITQHNMPIIDGDQEQFKRLCKELISNAMIYSKPNKATEINIHCHSLEDKYLFTVADKGIGIPPNIIERIFTMFYRGVLEKDYPAGQGIGLALCERIVQRHGGTLWCESEEGQGSRFHFTWPINQWREDLEKQEE